MVGPIAIRRGFRRRQQSLLAVVVALIALIAVHHATPLGHEGMHGSGAPAQQSHDPAGNGAHHDDADQAPGSGHSLVLLLACAGLLPLLAAVLARREASWPLPPLLRLMRLAPAVWRPAWTSPVGPLARAGPDLSVISRR